MRKIAAHADLRLILATDAYLHHDYLERLETAFPSLKGWRAPPAMKEAPFLRELWVWGARTVPWATSVDLARAPDATRALYQHAALARRLSADVPVVRFAGDPDHPDGMFPNNVFATTPGQLVIGSMRHAVRRREAARADIRGWFRDVLGYRETDLSGRACVAELTGALCIDRARGIGYCGLSERCDLAGAHAMHAAFGLRLTLAFELAPGEYHANASHRPCR